jgi:hypothetical protein
MAVDTLGQRTRPDAWTRARTYLRELKDSVLDTGHRAPTVAQSPSLRALRMAEKAVSVPMLGLIVVIYVALGGLVLLVAFGFLTALLAA